MTIYILVMEALAIIALTGAVLVLNSRISRLMVRVEGVALHRDEVLDKLREDLDNHRRIAGQSRGIVTLAMANLKSRVDALEGKGNG